MFCSGFQQMFLSGHHRPVLAVRPADIQGRPQGAVVGLSGACGGIPAEPGAWIQNHTSSVQEPAHRTGLECFCLTIQA